MKKEDLFKSMSELDVDLIAEAGEEGVEVTPIHIVEGKKRFNIKPIAVTAACCVLFAGAAVVGINYFRGGLDVQQPQSTNGAADYIAPEPGVHATSYPESAKYQYKGYYNEFNKFDTTSIICYANVYDSYSELLNDCDLAVVGEFIDDPWQDTDPDEHVGTFPSSYNSYNRFKIDKILGGEGATTKERGAEIIINQAYAIKDGRYLSDSKLTPMLKGDRWVYFLRFNEKNGTYCSLNDYMGRFPDPGYCLVYDRDPDLRESANQFLPAMTNRYGLMDDNDFNEKIYRTLTEILCPETIPSVQCLYDSENTDMYNVTSFELAEFENVLFTLKDGVLYVDKPWFAVNRDGVAVTSEDNILHKIFITDLNGDEKGEVCLQIHSDVFSEYILIMDYGIRDFYCIMGKTGESEYYLGESDGKLIAYNTKCTSDGSRGEVISDERLSLDMNDGFMQLNGNGHSEYCFQNADYCAQQGGICPYTDAIHPGHCEYCKVDPDFCAQQEGECPFSGHHGEESSSEHHGHNEYCLQDPDYCAQQEGECPFSGHHKEENSAEHHGHSELCLQDTSYCAQQEGECPYRQNGQEICIGVEKRGHYEYCLQDAAYCEQQEGECPYRQGEHHDEVNSTEHHGHSEYCLQDAAYCAQQGGDCPYRQDSHHSGGHHGDSHH